MEALALSLETRYAGPTSVVPSIGVRTTAEPTKEARGHAAGFASNTDSGHAFWIVSSLAGSLCGRSTFSARMFAWPAVVSITTCRLAPCPANSPFARVRAVSFGVNFRPAQFAVWNGTASLEDAPSAVDRDVEVLDLEGDAVDDRWDRARGDR